MKTSEKFRMPLNNRGARPGVAAAIAIVAAVLICSLCANSVFAAPQSAAPPIRIVKYRGTVVTANVASMVVRNPNDPREQMGFSFSPEMRNKMIAVMTAGGFRYGDKITVYYVYGSNVVVKMRGKPSKPKKLTPPPVTTSQ